MTPCGYCASQSKGAFSCGDDVSDASANRGMRGKVKYRSWLVRPACVKPPQSFVISLAAEDGQKWFVPDLIAFPNEPGSFPGWDDRYFYVPPIGVLLVLWLLVLGPLVGKLSPILEARLAPVPPLQPIAEARRSDKGLVWEVLERSNDAEYRASLLPDTAFVVVDYRCWRADGSVVEAKRNEMIILEEVGVGLREALREMETGERRRYWIPAGKAFLQENKFLDEKRAGDLVFEITLTGIKRLTPLTPSEIELLEIDAEEETRWGIVKALFLAWLLFLSYTDTFRKGKVCLAANALADKMVPEFKQRPLPTGCIGVGQVKDELIARLKGERDL